MEGTTAKKTTAAYLPGIMDASFYPSVEEIVICAADQSGKSFVVDTCIGYAIDREPGPVLYIYPDESTATENNRDRILPMITKSPRLRSYLTGTAADEAMKRVNLQHMQIYMAWARSAIKLANKSIKYLVFDETDKYPDNVNLREADPISKGEKRSRWYRYNRKMWKVSTPTIENGPIWQALNNCQMIFDFCVRCPDCGDVHIMLFDQIKWPEGERDPEKIENEDLAWYECPKCGAVWTDYKRNAAVLRGEWRARGDEAVGGGLELKTYLKKYQPRKIGFHLPSWISRFVGLSEVAAAFLKGQKDRNKLKDFQNSHAALPWKDYTQNRKEDRILSLRDDRPRGIVPAGGRVAALTAGVDTQDEGFWYEVRAWGWGMDMESWQIREGFVKTFGALTSILMQEAYLDADGNEFFIHVVVQDAMGHRTSEVYDFCRMHRRRVIPFQGVDTRRMTQPYTWTNIDFYPPNTKGQKLSIPGGIQLLRADVNFYKNDLAGKLEIASEDPGAWHMHSETTEEWARHMCAEYENNNGIWECPAGRANHGWDCSMMNLVAADLLRLKYWQQGKEKLGTRPEGRTETKAEGKWLPKKKGVWLGR